MVIEDAPDFAGNATKKALELAKWLRGQSAEALAGIGLDFGDGDAYTLADDSGLEVDSLQGAPGVRSARFAALDTGNSGNSPDAENNAKLLRLLAAVPIDQRTAQFKCVIALSPVLRPVHEPSSHVCDADESELLTQLFEGTCEGRIDYAGRGAHGFGYDPLFVPEGFTQSFAELGEEIKNQISHRAKALRRLQQWFAGK
jgi:XTP/dITP diphosphohydrolase